MKRAHAWLALLAAAVVTGGCSLVGISSAGPEQPTANGTTGASRSPATATTSPSPSPSPTPSPTPPPVPARWRPSADEVNTDLKAAATTVVHRLTNYEQGTTARQLARRVAPDGVDRTELAEAAGPLIDPQRWSRGEIVYPQLGGLGPGPCAVNPEDAAVMVVVRQRLGQGETVQRTVTRTVDVRMEADTGGAWRLSGLPSAGGRPAQRPAELADGAAAVVDDPRIVLPDSATWDIYRGRVHPDVLAVMRRLSERTPYAVSVLRTGHPRNVYGRGYPSDHTDGRAVDIYAVGGRPVVDSRGATAGGATCGSDATREGPAFQQVTWLLGLEEVRQVGSPWDLDPPNNPSFDDLVHQDHIHVGVGGRGWSPATPSAPPAPTETTG